MTPSDRYLVGLPRGAGRIFLSWRLLASDRPDACFHVERRRGDRWERVSSESVVDSTNFLDRIPEPARYEYRVTAPEGSPSQSIKVDSGAPATLGCAFSRTDRGLGKDRAGRFEQRRPDGLRGLVHRRRRGPIVRLSLRWQADEILKETGKYGGKIMSNEE